MNYQATITKKGQILVPKKIRDYFHIHTNQKLSFEIADKEGGFVVRPTRDILDLAGHFHPKKTVSALHVREEFEKHYERK
jgi:AbrB family looped-hinge helix DNA binding protein